LPGIRFVAALHTARFSLVIASFLMAQLITAPVRLVSPDHDSVVLNAGHLTRFTLSYKRFFMEAE
jgi:hypothetical protein